MWSWSELKGRLNGRAPTAMPAAGEDAAIGLDLDELISMRGRHVSFGRNQRVQGFRFGDITSRRRGTGLELDNIGPYQWGDDIRHMDWLATARTGRAQVRQFRHDVQQTIIVALDLRPSMIFGTSRQLMAKTACLAAAKIAWSTSHNHQPLGFLIISQAGAALIPPRRGRRARLQHLARIVDAYRAAVPTINQPVPTLDDAINDLAPAMAGDVEAVIVSDFSGLGEHIERRLREAGARGGLSAIVVEDGLMQRPPPEGVYPLRTGDDPALATVAIRTGDENVYIEQADGKRRALAARLMSLGMRQVLISDPTSMAEGYFR